MPTLKLTKKYNHYIKYKDSGVEWVGEIPAEWNAQKLYTQFDFRNEKVSDEDYEPLSVTYGGVVPQIENAAKSNAEGSCRKLVKKGDVAINGRSDRRGAAGLSEYDGSVSLVYHVLKPRSGEQPSQYYHYLIRSTIFGDEFYRWGRGIVDDLWTTRSTEMKRIIIPVLPKSEQDKIATYLDEKTALIDAIIEKKKRQIELLREKRAAIINRAVTKGIDPKARLVDSGIEWIGMIPEGWEVKKIKHVIKSVTSGVWGDEAKGDENDIKCLRVADFDFDHLTYGTVETVRNNERLPDAKVLNAGDLLIEKSGGGEKTPVGRVIEFDGAERMTCANFIDIARADRSKMVPAFLVMYFYSLYASRAVRKYIKQNTGIQNLDIKAYFTEPVVFPNTDEQEAIVQYVQSVISAQREIEEKMQESIERLQEFKSALISHVVTGKVKV